MGREQPLDPRLLTLRAYATHAFTATGAVFAFLALLAAVDGRWPDMFGWLVVAFVVDGVDGALARRTDVVTHAPIIDGVLLDLVIDYLTYVFIPVFALLRAGFLPGRSGAFVALLVTFASALYFADTRMKTADRSFSGFPAVWNLLALAVFIADPSSNVLFVLLVLIVVLAVAMFVPVKFVHPVRTERWRLLSLPAAAIWTALAGWAALTELTLPAWARVTLLISGTHLLLAGALQQLLDRVAQRGRRGRRPATARRG